MLSLHTKRLKYKQILLICVILLNLFFLDSFHARATDTDKVTVTLDFTGESQCEASYYEFSGSSGDLEYSIKDGKLNTFQVKIELNKGSKEVITIGLRSSSCDFFIAKKDENGICVPSYDVSPNEIVEGIYATTKGGSEGESYIQEVTIIATYSADCTIHFDMRGSYSENTGFVGDVYAASNIVYYDEEGNEIHPTGGVANQNGVSLYTGDIRQVNKFAASRTENMWSKASEGLERFEELIKFIENSMLAFALLTSFLVAGFNCLRLATMPSHPIKRREVIMDIGTCCVCVALLGAVRFLTEQLYTIIL